MAVDMPREIALKIIYDVNEKGAYSNIALNKHLEAAELKSVDRGFITELVYGTVKWKKTIDWIIAQFSSVRIKKISPWILNIMRLGIYQLLYMDKVPESAACNECVNLSKKYGHSASSRFVNGVLRSVSRKRSSIVYPDKDEDLIMYLAVKYSYPEWLVKKWMAVFGEEFTEGLLAAGNEIPEFTVRANTLKLTKQQLLEELMNERLETLPGRYVETAVRLNNPSSVARLDAFKKGYFQVQDESSMLVGLVADPKPGELIMDVCSAPGGKAAHLAQLMKNQGVVVARDIHEHKIKLINEAALRLGLDIIKTELYDASEIDSNYIGKADRVLVDAPCTGLGIISKKPDIKWARNLEDTNEITSLQRKILEASSRYVKKGGILIYSTCTIMPEENELMVKEFLSRNTEFESEDFTSLLPAGLKDKSASKGYIQLYPNSDGIDGFFIAKMIRKG